MQGKFITLEGGEGSGKSTQCKALAEHLKAKGIEVYLTREPGGSDGAELIRELLVTGDTNRWSPMTEALLMTAARADHVEKVIKPKLNAGIWVISDRFYHSMYAYQGFGHGLDVAQLQRLTHTAIGTFTPDLTFILDLPVAIGMARAGGREQECQSGEDRFERMGTSFHEAIRQGFLTLAKEDVKACQVINANDTADTITKSLWQGLVSRFDL